MSLKHYQVYSLLAFLAVFLSFRPAELSAQTETFKEIIGHDIGERITENHQVVSYLTYLAETSDRVIIHQIGRTYNQKLQLAAIVTHPDNHARLGEIRDNANLLAHPEGITTEQAEKILLDQPVVLYLGGSIHGNELSGAEALLKVLEHFTVSGDEETLSQLRNTVILVDPVINADGRDAFAGYNHQHQGRSVTADPADWSNDFTSWDRIKFRTSHYFFDLNRDWFAHTHPETRNRALLLQEWPPQAGVDAHEMNSEREFYMDPPSAPQSPWFPPYATKWLEEYGLASAGAFDRNNIEYTHREIFNYFYPAYLTSYMTYQGAAGLLYEQGSSRGFAWKLSDGTVRSLSGAAFNQYTAFRSMIRLSSERRQELLTDYYYGNIESIESGSEGFVRYLIKREGDPALVAEAVNLLMRSGIDVQRLARSTTLQNVRNRTGETEESHSFEEGTYLVEAAQPRSGFIRNLLEPHIRIPEDFLEEARARVDRGESPRFYDITSWSLPLLFNLQGFSSTDRQPLEADPVTGPVTAGGGAPADTAKYAYLIDGSQASLLSAIYPLREEGIRLHILYKPTSINGKLYNSGTLVVRTDGNEEQVHRTVSRLAETFDLTADPVDTGLSDPGYPPLGTIEGNRVTKPVIALLGDYPVNGYSFGWAWHTLDRVYDIPLTVIRPDAISSTPMERFNVLVMPEIQSRTQLDRYLGEDGIERLVRWVHDGGTLVTIGSATDYARSVLELTDLGSWYEEDENSAARRISVPGAFFRADMDDREWLVSGYSYSLPLLINSSRLYRVPDRPPHPSRRSPVQISMEENALVSGHAWSENSERLPGSVFLHEQRVQSGRVISFAEDVNFRGYWRGADRLFLNAVILGPGAP
ncbi:MAG: M14 family zinc carboxypeptidase [Balneolaceae bacterium]